MTHPQAGSSQEQSALFASLYAQRFPDGAVGVEYRIVRPDGTEVAAYERSNAIDIEWSPDGRKVKATLHWVSAAHARSFLPQSSTIGGRPSFFLTPSVESNSFCKTLLSRSFSFIHTGMAARKD